jgi:small ligand-binding sensory domain FIST
VTEAVDQALKRLDSSVASGLLLFLSADFARHAQDAVAAASRAANCLQVYGATFPGVFTEDDWVLDGAGAAVLAFRADLSLTPASNGSTVPRLSLAEPSCLPDAWRTGPPSRFGAVATDAAGQGAGRVWSRGRVISEGAVELEFRGLQARLSCSRGLQALTPPARVSAATAYELQGLDDQGALDHLLAALPPGFDTPPLHLAFAAILDADADAAGSESAFAAGRYHLVPLIGTNPTERSLTLTEQIPAGARLVWCLRSSEAALADTAAVLERLAPPATAAPTAAVMLSCMGRGPYFFGGTDRDLALVRERFPHLPILGAYSAGEIAPTPAGNALVHNSAVLALLDHVV